MKTLKQLLSEVVKPEEDVSHANFNHDSALRLHNVWHRDDDNNQYITTPTYSVQVKKTVAQEVVPTATESGYYYNVNVTGNYPETLEDFLRERRIKYRKKDDVITITVSNIDTVNSILEFLFLPTLDE